MQFPFSIITRLLQDEVHVKLTLRHTRNSELILHLKAAILSNIQFLWNDKFDKILMHSLKFISPYMSNYLK